MIKIRNVPPFAALVVLLMTTVAAAKIIWNPSSSLLIEVTDPSVTKNSIVSGDLLDDRQIAIATRVMNSSNLPVNISVQLVGPNNTKRECLVPFWNFLCSPKRLNRKFVLIPVNVNDKNGFPSLKLLLVNMKNCKYDFAHKGVVRNYAAIVPISENSTDGRFVVTLLGKDVCQGHDWCRLFFDPLYERYELMDFGPGVGYLDRVEPASTSNFDLFVVRFVDDLGTYRARLYHLSDNRTGSPPYKELFTLGEPKASNGSSFPRFFIGLMKYTVQSSGLSFCWHLSVNDSSVHCLRFREDGSLMFNKTMVFFDTINMFEIVTIPNGLVLFTYEGRENILQARVITPECNDCSALLSTSQTIADDEVRVKTARYSLPCMGNLISFKVRQMDASSDTYEVQYLCVGSSAISSGVFYV